MSMPIGGPPPRRTPTDGIPKPGSIKELPRYLYLRARGFFHRLFYIITLVWQSSPTMLLLMSLFCLLDGLIPVAGAYITSELLNSIASLIGSAATDDAIYNLTKILYPVLFLFLLLFIYQFFSRILQKLSSMVTAVSGELVVNHIRKKIISKAKEVDQRSFDSPQFYEKLENANREAGMRPIGILTATFNVISAFISVVSFIVVLGTLTPLAPVLIIIASIPGAFVNYYFKKRNFGYMRRHSKERRKMNYYSALMTNKDYAKEIKILSLGDTFEEKYDEAFDEYYGGLRRLITREGITQTLVGLVQVFVTVALFIYVAYTIVFGGGEIGDYSLYTGALTSITGYVATLVASTATIYEGTLFIENMIDFMSEPTTVVPTVNPPRIPERGHHIIEFSDVSFKYPGSEENVINHVNLRIESGKSLVLVGLNGAGKSTLLKLMMRLYDPTEGVILLDGYDIREYDVAALRSMYGIIFQDFGKYADTVSENIRFGDIFAECSIDKIKEASSSAGADEFIGELAQKYETPLTRLFEQDGIELSGGQWQKLSVARAFYKDSDILIMDEPTASLDPLAEAEVFSKFSELSEGRLSVFVSHRLSGAVGAGQIVVLENGEIAESGTHDELMAGHGRYYLLFSTQAKKYTE